METKLSLTFLALTRSLHGIILIQYIMNAGMLRAMKSIKLYTYVTNLKIGDI